MTSPLDGRIRNIVREEIQAAGGDTDGDGHAGLQQQMTDLHEHLHIAATRIKHLEDKLEALEDAQRAPDEELPAPRRTRRKPADQ